MPESWGKCELCKKGDLKLVGTKELAETQYKILKCSQCGHKVARHTD